MRVSLATHGGMAAPIVRRLPPRVLDTRSLPDDVARELRRLVAAVSTDNGAMTPRRQFPDAMSYRITVEDGGPPTTLTGSDETMSPAFRELLTWIQHHTT